MVRRFIFSFAYSKYLALNQDNLIGTLIIHFVLSFELFKFMPNTLTLFVVPTKEVFVGSKLIL